MTKYVRPLYLTFIAMMLVLAALGTPMGTTSAAAAPALDAPCLDGSVVGAMQNKLDRTPIGLGESPAATQLSWTGEGFPYGDGGFDRTIIVTNAMNNAYQVFALNTETVHMTKHCGSIEEVKAYVSLPSSYNNAMRLTAMDAAGNMPKVSEIGVFYVDLSTNQLVELVHAADGPTIAEVQKHLQVVDLATGLVIGLAQASAGSASAAVSTETHAATQTALPTQTQTALPTQTQTALPDETATADLPFSAVLTKVDGNKIQMSLENAGSVTLNVAVTEGDATAKNLTNNGKKLSFTLPDNAYAFELVGADVSSNVDGWSPCEGFNGWLCKTAEEEVVPAAPKSGFSIPNPFSTNSAVLMGNLGNGLMWLVIGAIVIFLLVVILGLFVVRNIWPRKGKAIIPDFFDSLKTPVVTITPAALPAAKVTAKALRSAVPTLSLPQAQKVAKAYPDATALKLASVAALKSVPMSDSNANKVYAYAQNL